MAQRGRAKTAELQRCLDDQRQAASLLLASGCQLPCTAFQFGTRQWLADLVAEEMIITSSEVSGLASTGNPKTETRTLLPAASGETV